MAVILWDGYTESMILSARVQADDLKKLSQLIWIVPLYSKEKMLVEASDINVYYDVIKFMKPRRQRPSYGNAAMVEQKKIDIYDIAILTADNAEDLIRLIRSLGYVIPENASEVLHSCIESGMHYFVVNKINLADKYGKGIQDIETLTTFLMNVDAAEFKNLLTRFPHQTAIQFEDAVKRLADTYRRNTTNSEIVHSSHYRLGIMKVLNLFRRAAIMSLMAGVPYQDSILATELGRNLALIPEKVYERLVRSVRIQTNVYDTLQLYSGPEFMWDEHLMPGREWTPDYSRMDYRCKYGPEITLMVYTEKPGMSASFSDGRRTIHFDEDLRKRLTQKGISVDAYKKFLETNLYAVEMKYKKAFDALTMEKFSYYSGVFKELSAINQGIVTPIKSYIQTIKTVLSAANIDIESGDDSYRCELLLRLSC